MPGALSFKIDVYQTNANILPDLQSKVRDLSPVFEQIINAWAKGNAEKFGLASGASLSGAEIDPTVFWQALTEPYFKEKSKRYPNQIMVRTGSLRDALTNPSGFFQMVTPDQAIFGRPNDLEDVMKMEYNWVKRQTVFLGDADQNMIRMYVSRFFNSPPPQSLQQEAAQMDTDFANTVSDKPFPVIGEDL